MTNPNGRAHNPPHDPDDAGRRVLEQLRAQGITDDDLRTDVLTTATLDDVRAWLDGRAPCPID